MPYLRFLKTVLVKIFATGDESRIDELKLKFGNEVFSTPPIEVNSSVLLSYNVIFDLNADEKISIPDSVFSQEDKLLIVCAVKKTLASLIGSLKNEIKCSVAGMNMLPTFINRSQLEVSFLSEEDRKAFTVFAGEMKTDYQEVKDLPGMVTPRVISMIINEACYALQEGTASKEDIDKAMKLGTNYPYGTLEWCDRIGVKDIYETLEALWNEGQDERYRICPLLKNKYQKREKFYS